MPDCQDTSITFSAVSAANNTPITGNNKNAANNSTETAEHFPYLPHTREDRLEMLDHLGVDSFDDLIKHIPANLKAKPLALPNKMSELELVQEITKLAKKNKTVSAQSCFLGGGSYNRFVPAIVPAIISRSEFATSYTPYQAEVSQGNLQSIYEFQTAVALLTDMDVANASMYDGPTACAEAALMACRITNRNKIILSDTLNPEYLSVVSTYIKSCGLILEKLPCDNGITKNQAVSNDVAAIIIQYPNYFGIIEEIKKLEEASHAAGALFIMVCDPISLGYLTPPGQFGADIAVGDAQSCGNFLSFGGPSAGFIACKQEYVRQLPGRLAGKTVDSQGLPAYTLTLQAREQHIRRSNATSNICTNQALNALAMLVYICALGPQGIKTIAYGSLQKAHYLADALTKIPGVKLAFDKPFFNEFVIITPQPAAEVLAKLSTENILGGIDLSHSTANITNGILISVTEMNDIDELDHYVSVLKRLLN